jgi:hypothetical protein
MFSLRKRRSDNYVAISNSARMSTAVSSIPIPICTNLIPSASNLRRLTVDGYTNATSRYPPPPWLSASSSSSSTSGSTTTVVHPSPAIHPKPPIHRGPLIHPKIPSPTMSAEDLERMAAFAQPVRRKSDHTIKPRVKAKDSVGQRRASTVSVGVRRGSKDQRGSMIAGVSEGREGSLGRRKAVERSGSTALFSVDELGLGAHPIAMAESSRKTSSIPTIGESWEGLPESGSWAGLPYLQSPPTQPPAQQSQPFEPSSTIPPTQSHFLPAPPYPLPNYTSSIYASSSIQPLPQITPPHLFEFPQIGAIGNPGTQWDVAGVDMGRSSRSELEVEVDAAMGPAYVDESWASGDQVVFVSTAHTHLDLS